MWPFPGVVATRRRDVRYITFRSWGRRERDINGRNRGDGESAVHRLEKNRGEVDSSRRPHSASRSRRTNLVRLDPGFTREPTSQLRVFYAKVKDATTRFRSLSDLRKRARVHNTQSRSCVLSRSVYVSGHRSEKEDLVVIKPIVKLLRVFGLSLFYFAN